MNTTFKRIILAGTATLLLGGVALAQEMITVQPGDTLTSIAIENLGKANLAQSICDANSATLNGNCDALEIGTKLILPEMAMDATMEKSSETMTAEEMEKAEMEKKAMEMVEMEKATMEKEAMEKATMEKEAMEKAEMEKATMEKEAMEKAEMEKKAMEMADGEHAMAACMDAAAGEAGAIEKCKMAAEEMAPAK
jgi:spore germination protein YaaH